MANNKSLKSGILFRLLIPILLFIILESVLSYFVTLHYVDETYERWLLDSANSLAQEIKVRHAKVLVELPIPALEIVRWDDLDKTYFKITSVNKGLLTGDTFVPEPEKPINFSSPVFFNANIDKEPVRVVSMRVERPDVQDTFYIHVAETLKKRRIMMTDILLADLIPQLVMIIFAVGMLYVGLSKGLKPLKVLADEIAKRSPNDLSPIADTHVLTEVKILTDTINDLLTRMSTTILGQQRFVANAAHQLRTPLAGFAVQVERALREQDMASIKPALTQMQKSAGRLTHTVNQLLMLAKSEPTDGMVELKPINLVPLIKSTCIDWAPKALQRQTDLSFECSEQFVLVQGDETLLRELLVNLLDNAILYGHDKGHIIVSLVLSPTPILSIEDDGPGIPESEISKIFERFYRIPGSSGVGCGLGLAIVKEIANLHRVNLKLTKTNDKGGTKITLVFEHARQAL